MDKASEVMGLFGERLKAARVMRRESLRALGGAVGVSHQTLRNYELGKAMPDSATLSRISSALGLRPDYFVRKRRVDLSEVRFRKRASMPARDVASIGERVRDMAERYFEAEELSGDTRRCDLPRRSVLAPADAARAAAWLKEEWRLGDGGIASVTGSLEDLGVVVLELSLGDKFDGMCFTASGRPVIVVNGDAPPERRRLTAMHELGHMVLDFPAGCAEVAVEGACNDFASEMLLSGGVFLGKLGGRRKDISLEELRDLQRQYGISPAALMVKARRLGVISESRYSYFFVKQNTSPAFKARVAESLYADDRSTRMRRLVFRLLADGVVTESRAAALLGVGVAEVREGLALV